MGELVAFARDLAHSAHAGQVDKAGRPYIEHVARVAAAVSDDPIAEATAWLHDVLEDAPQWFWQSAVGLPFDVLAAVVDLTRGKRPSEYYYWIIRHNPLALRVKLADIADNADEARLALLPEATADRLRRKYAQALAALSESPMAKWHAQPEYLSLFTDQPPRLAGYCVVDEDGRYYMPNGARWINDKESAEQMADELNAEVRDG